MTLVHAIMTLVYLDTSNHDTLARARTREPERFARFLARWRELGCELAFCRSHLVELLRYADEETRRGRFDLLDVLLPVRTDITPRLTVPTRPLMLLDREVLRAMQTQGVLSSASPEQAAWYAQIADVFPYRWADPQATSTARKYDTPIFHQHVAQAHAHAEREFAKRTRPASTKVKPIKLRDLPDSPLSVREAEDAEAAVATLMAFTDAEVQEMFPLTTVAGGRAIIAASYEPLHHLLVRAQSIGLQGAYMESMSVDLTRAGKKSVSDILLDAFFADEVRRVLTDTFQFPPTLAHTLAQRIQLIDCPGQWLVRTVEREAHAREAEQDPSNAYDFEHVGHLPYVDVFFTDKRIGTYTSDVLRRAGAPPSLAGRAPRWVAATVDAIEAALEPQ